MRLSVIYFEIVERRRQEVETRDDAVLATFERLARIAFAEEEERLEAHRRRLQKDDDTD